MEHYDPTHDQEGPYAALLAILAERGAWRLRSHNAGREVVLDTLLGRMVARDASIVDAVRAVGHAPAHAACARIDEDVCIEAVPPVIAQGSRALATAGLVSGHAFELVTAALDAGRNVLCLGPYGACWPVMAAWMETGAQPAILTQNHAASRRWRRLMRTDEAVRWSADRVGIWGRAPSHVARACKRLGGVVAHIESHGLERGLMRFEQAMGKAGPLGVLSAIDLVVCASLDRDQKAHVDGMYEIVMTETAYRPSPLFVRHRDAHERTPGTLLATALPTFVDVIAPVAREGLLDELAAAVGTALPRPAQGAEAAASHAGQAYQPGELERRVAAHASHAPPDAHGPFQAQAAMMLQQPRTAGPASARGRANPSAPRAPQAATRKGATPSPRHLPLSPGWELDQMEMADLSGPLPFPEDEPGAEDGAPDTNDLDAAALAATFGLAPPRAPRGIAADAAQPMAPRPTADGQAPSFLDALAKTSRATQGNADTFQGPPPRAAIDFDEETVAARKIETGEQDQAEPRGDEPHER